MNTAIKNDVQQDQAETITIPKHLLAELAKVAEYALEYIDDIPKSVELHSMIGFDRDWADGTLYDAKKTLETAKITKVTPAGDTDGNGLCPVCGTKDRPCCDMGPCEPIKGERGSSMCLHCGGELIERDGAWYHHSQFDADHLGPPQCIVQVTE